MSQQEKYGLGAFLSIGHDPISNCVSLSFLPALPTDIKGQAIPFTSDDFLGFARVPYPMFLDFLLLHFLFLDFWPC